jgi:hypothetical protein
VIEEAWNCVVTKLRQKQMNNFSELTVCGYLNQDVQDHFICGSVLGRSKIMKGMLKSASIAAFAAILGFSATTTRAAQVVVVAPDQTVDLSNGWDITTAAGISLTVTVSGNTITVEKHAAFLNSNSLGITFDGTASASAATVVLTGENLTNESGDTWSGFYDVVNNEIVGGTATVTSAFVGGNVGGTYVLTLSSNSGGIVAYTGSQASGTTSNWGSYVTLDTSTFSIAASAHDVFTLDEIPIAGGSDAVALPSAAWQGLIGLGGLAIFAFSKKLKATA